MLLSRALILLPLGVAGARVGPEVRALPMDPDRAVFLEEDARQPSPVRFAEVQAVLADRCFACHGPDDRAREAGLRLDRREEALAVLAPGDPDSSELVARILDDGADRMPPRDSKLELSAAERDLLVRWVAEGATYDGHWAWTAPGAGQAGPKSDAGAPAWAGAWCRDPLDARVAAALDEVGLRPGPEVDPASWLRRASVVLTGLPPTPAELERFEEARAAAAEPEVIDALEAERLLTSPRAAEHLTAAWLDAARYADTYGYQNDVDRTVWPWRDWVLRAFQEDKPYDAFLVEQLAGDLLPDATPDQVLATAFNRLHRQTNEGGSVEEEFRVEYVADRVNTFGTAVLGLTMECARCHDHKYDPLTQREYYGLSAFFDNIDESGLYSHFSSAVPTPTVDLATDEQAARLETLASQLAEAEAALEALPFDEDAFETWRQQLTRGAASLDPASTPGLQGLYPMDDGDRTSIANRVEGGKSGQIKGPTLWREGRRGGGLGLNGDDALEFLGAGVFRRWDAFSLGLWIQPAEHHARAVVLHRSRAWHDSGSRGYQLLLEDGRPSFSLIHFWPGNALRVRALEPVEVGRWTHLAVTYDGSSTAAGVRLFVDGAEIPVEVVRDQLTRTIQGSGEGLLSIGARFRDNGFRGGAVDELFVAARELAPFEIRGLAGAQAAAHAPTEGDLRATFRARPADAERAALRARVRALRQQHAEEHDRVREVMAMREMTPRRTTRVLNRGLYDQPLEAVEPHTPALLPPLDPEGPVDRLALARWVVRPDHPLTARVAVNRLWQQVFGEGIVSTQENFGVQGSGPWSQELLDHLARTFVADGWSVRRLLKRLVLSSTFRQAAPRLEGADPRRRLDAEALRDHALLASGLLVERLGGPSVKPYQPAGLWKEKSGRTYDQGHGEDLHRRSLYTFWKRTSPPPTMMIFDAAKRDVCVVRRRPTSTPMQALVLWNDPQFVEAGRVLAASLLRAHPGDEERLDELWLRCATRRPTDAERATTLELLADLRADYAAHPEDAAAACAVGEAPPAEGLDPIEHAAWTLTCVTVFSHHASVSLR